MGDRETSIDRLVTIVQELSLARDLGTVMAIVRRGARELTGADGATFVLRDEGRCFYADEDAIEPLWKGQRFPMSACISGWSMLHREPVVLPDIYADARVPADAYRPTFVKSLVMVPIRKLDPIGAIGTYWATTHTATEEQVRVLSALADSTSIALENVQLYQSLEQRVADRTAELAAKHAALERAQRHKEELAALLVHDLRSPASGLMLAAKARLRSREIDDRGRHQWQNVHTAAEAIHRMAMNLLDITRSEDGSFSPRRGEVSLPQLLGEVVELMAPLAAERAQRLALATHVAEPILACDAELVRRVLQNLVDNGLRYTPEAGEVRIEARDECDGVEIRVDDQGPGVPAEQRRAIFDKWSRAGHPLDRDDASGRGLGLTFCRLAVEAHGGSIGVEPGAAGGSSFVVRLPRRALALSA
ncbi:MAG TPA: ATP-binding protein [Kofleriaceae bacterium]|nr:ATP-binding protein [Kofleriaceae bacterium]